MAKHDLEAWRPFAKKIIDFLTLSKIPKGKLLDVGCSHGLVVEEALKKGFAAEGLEPSQGAVQFCRQKGLKVTQNYFTEGVFPCASFDIVIMSHVLEHISNPDKTIQTLKEIIKPGGYFLLCQTNYKGIGPRILKKHWGGWGIEEHYYHFTIPGIKFLLSKNGLQPSQIKINSIGTGVEFKNANLKDYPILLYQKSILTMASWISKCLPLGDQMFVLVQV